VNLIVKRAHQVADDLAHARSRRTFLSALDHFERMLSLVPDYPPGCLTADDGRELGALADTVVTHVEERLDHHTDRAAVQRALADKIYAIRRDLEQVHRRLRDEAGHPSPMPAAVGPSFSPAARRR